MSVPNGAASFAERLDAFAERLERLERRVAQLERDRPSGLATGGGRLLEQQHAVPVVPGRPQRETGRPHDPM